MVGDSLAGACNTGQLLLLSAVDACCGAGPDTCLAVSRFSAPPSGACNTTSPALCRSNNGACGAVDDTVCVQPDNSCTPLASNVTCASPSSRAPSTGVCDGTGYCGEAPMIDAFVDKDNVAQQ